MILLLIPSTATFSWFTCGTFLLCLRRTRQRRRRWHNSRMTCRCSGAGSSRCAGSSHCVGSSRRAGSSPCAGASRRLSLPTISAAGLPAITCATLGLMTAKAFASASPTSSSLSSLEKAFSLSIWTNLKECVY